MEKTFGERLKKIRENNKETQSDLAKALNIRRENIIRYENGDLPKFEVVIKIARHYNTTIDYFAGLIDSPISYDKHYNYDSIPNMIDKIIGCSNAIKNIYEREQDKRK